MEGWQQRAFNQSHKQQIMKLTKNTTIVAYDNDRLTVKDKRGKITQVEVLDLQYDTWIERLEPSDSDTDIGVLQIVSMKLFTWALDAEGYEIEKPVKADKDFAEKFSIYLAEGYDWGAYMNQCYESEKDFYDECK